jgi:hypothetical protein|tara:strand:+ start:1462 stop:3108 length:1647 start_codon:yes stop_codon:yes gene_type:complete
MALNPFFLQGSQGEQRLVQDLINEHLRIYGVEVTYIPRKFVARETIMEEVTSSKFDDNFLIEAYVNTYEGYSGSGDILTKFGMSLRDEVTLTLSKERFEDFIAPFLDAMPESEVEVSTRPREGDLIYFPLGQRLFEVKFVEHEKPFYQLGKNYVYELKCELFEYEDEVIDTDIDEIDTQIQDEGFITTLNLVGTGRTATATATLSQPTGYIRKIILNNDGSGYNTAPTVAISTAPSGGVNATAVAITTSIGGVKSIKEILLTNAGSGYVTPPLVTILNTGTGGVGAAATALIETTGKGVINFTVVDEGVGYSNSSPPLVTIGEPTGSGTTAVTNAQAVVFDSKLSSIRIRDAGIGHTVAPTVTVGNPTIITGIGTYQFNEIVKGVTSGTEARVKSWDSDTKVLKVSMVGIGTTVSGFIPGEEVRSTESLAFITNVSFGATIGIQTNIISGISTAGISIADDIADSVNVIGAGITVSAIGAGQITLSQSTINLTPITQTVSIGTTTFTTYSVSTYDDRDIYDEYSENDEFEVEADDIIDFSQSNPFGTY